MDFNEKLKVLRQRKGISQESMAELLNMKQNSYSQYENRFRQPSFETLKKIAEIFNVSVDYLLGTEKEDLVSPKTYPFDPAYRLPADITTYEEAMEFLSYHKMIYAKGGFMDNSKKSNEEIIELARSILGIFRMVDKRWYMALRVKKLIRELKKKYPNKSALEILEEMNVEVHQCNSTIIEQLKAVTSNYQGKMYIWLYKDISDGSKEFILAHELGHIMLHDDLQNFAFGGNYLENTKEREADEFAFRFLIYGLRITEKTTYQTLSDKTGVPVEYLQRFDYAGNKLTKDHDVELAIEEEVIWKVYAIYTILNIKN